MQRQIRPKSLNKREPRVEDLREKLNRIKQEKLNDENGVSKNLPPPDPTYNFLKDPMRGDDFDKPGKTSPKKISPKKQNDESVLPKKDVLQSNLPSPNKFEINRGPQDEKRNQNWRDKKYINKKEPPPSPKEKPKHEILNQLPLNNIKVEFSGETGKRKCIIDESKTIELPKIDDSKFDKQLPRETQKYYYNRQTQERRSFREKKSDDNKDLGKGTDAKQNSNYKKNYKQKKDYKRPGEELISKGEHASEDYATRVENASCDNNDAHQAKHYSNYKKNYKQKKDYKRPGEELISKVEHASEDNPTRVENDDTHDTKQNSNYKKNYKQKKDYKKPGEELLISKVEPASEDNATISENVPCENNDAHEDHELIKNPIVNSPQEL